MLPSWRLALNILSGRPVRSGLMIGAIALSAALVVAVSSAISSVQASMQFGLEQLLGSVDARIIHAGGGRFDESLLETVRSWPEVDHAAPRLVGTLTLVREDAVAPRRGEGRLTPNAVGVDFATDRFLRDLQIIAGEMPRSTHEVLLDSIAAELLHASPGEALIVQRFGDPVRLTVSGIYERQRLIAMIQRPQIRVDRGLLEEITGLEGQLTNILIAVHDGVDVQAFCDRYMPEVPEVLMLEPAEMASSGFDRRIEASRIGILIASVLTFMCAGFIIVTAMTTSILEQQRELALLRSIGAARKQLVIAQLTVGASLGTAGAIIGLPLGVLFAWMLTSMYHEQLPAGLVVHGLGMNIGLAGSLAAGLVGAAYPAWEAGRVMPLEAMTRVARPPRVRSFVFCSAIGLVLLAVQVALIYGAASQDARFYTYAYIGLPAMLLGYFVLAVPMLLLVTLVFARPLSALLYLPRDMLGRSLLATPFRNGFTAGALMVGIAILVSTWAGGRSLLDGWIGRIQFADGFAYHPSGIRPAQQEAIAALPGVLRTCPIGYLPLRVIGQQVFGVEGIAPANVVGIGFDPNVFFSMNAVDWIQGEQHHAVQRLRDGDAILVAERFLVARGLGVGDTLRLGAGRVERDFEIVGVVSSAGLDIATQVFGVRSAYMEYAVSAVFLDFRVLENDFDNRDAYILQLDIAADVTDTELSDAIDAAAPGVRFRSGRWILETIHRIVNALLAAQSVIAFAALLLACCGVANVIVANVRSRRYEFGVLRAVGAPRGVLLRLILGESAMLALTGAFVGTLLGIHLSLNDLVFYRDMAGLPLRFSMPTIPTGAGWLVLIMMVLLASLPAAISMIRRTPSALLAVGRAG